MLSVRFTDCHRLFACSSSRQRKLVCGPALSLVSSLLTELSFGIDVGRKLE